MSHDPQIQAEHKINQLITQLHQNLSKNFTTMEHSRDLQPDQNIILSELNQRSIQYQNLVGILAIDTYVNNILEHNDKFNDVLATLTMLIQNFITCKKENFSNKSVRSLQISLHGVMHSCHKFNPQSSYVQLQKMMMEDDGSLQFSTLYDNLIIKLEQEKQALKNQLNSAQRQINELQFKLQSTLNQQAEVQQIVNNSNFYALKEQLYNKQQQIKQMNDDFSYEINKYNAVFDKMKQEIQEIRYTKKQYGRKIQKLQNQIAYLLNEKQRDECIVRDLISRREHIQGQNEFYVKDNGNRNKHKNNMVNYAHKY